MYFSAGYQRRALSKEVKGNRLETGDAHEPRDLTGNNTECGARYEAGDSGQRDELDYPAEAEQSNGEEDETTNKCYFGCDLWARPSVGVLFIDVFDNLGDLERHDRDGANGNIFGRGKQL